jgi:hypothetical protein
MGSNPGNVFLMDVSNNSYYIKFIHKNNENKGSQMGHTKKYLKRRMNEFEVLI